MRTRTVFDPIRGVYTTTFCEDTNVGFIGGKIPPITVSTIGYTCIPDIKNVIFNPPATIVFWSDNTKTVVKCMEGREFDKWEGLSMAICKKLFGKKFKHTFKKWCEND